MQQRNKVHLLISLLVHSLPAKLHRRNNLTATLYGNTNYILNVILRDKHSNQSNHLEVAKNMKVDHISR